MANTSKVIKSDELDKNLIDQMHEVNTSLFTCFQCGQCTSSCPVTESFPKNPHKMVRLAGLGAKKEIINDDILRYCLTCRTCQEYCPQNVDFIEFIKNARSILVNEEIEYEETHSGILTTLTELQAKSKSGFSIPPNLVPDGYEFLKKGKVAYFYGCLPLLDTVFDYLNVDLLKIGQDAIKILNKVLDEPPVIIDNIKCCGHDALWKGYSETFQQLAEHNVKEIKKLGIETIITTCAECYRTLKLDYPKYVKDANFNVLHISELIANKLEDKSLKFTEKYFEKVTYHDPCRLGRHMKVYSPPRDILVNMKQNGIKFKDMERSKEQAPCCGVSCFINCNDLSKVIQLDRLNEAKNIANIMLTTCTKCQIHYKCILREKKEAESEKIDLEILDLTSLISKLMGLSNTK